MRNPIALLLAGLLAPAALAQAPVNEHVVYLHENPLHILPEVINANVGDTLRITVHNPEAPGKTPHNFLVCGDGKKPQESCDDRWGFTGMIQPGESAVVTVDVKKAGVFEYYCYIAGHKGGGMVGELVVAGDESRSVPGIAPLAALAALGLVAIWRRGRP
ncbi:MAG TPA: cupredoxin domain-containing protein [Candidatus Thermoplasmatota archaeon]|nr:cupredoxin domain-containing protein [Candidatus Thermoplasmatota archaeon]